MGCISNPQKRISRWLLLSLMFVIKLSQANNIFNEYNLGFYDPRISIWGYEGTLGLVKGDGLLPLLGNEDNVFFSDFQAKYASDDSTLISAGLGFRHIQDNARILGVYFFADQNRSTQHKNFWFLSPGVESLGNLWDFRGNAYFPLSERRKAAGTVFADQINDFYFVNFFLHQQYDHLLNRFNEVGPGADVEIGRLMPGTTHARLFIGVYYFSLHDVANMKGSETRLEYNVNRYITLEATDSYDNIFHNGAELGVRFTLGGINPNNTSMPIENRILDPITRNLSTINSGSGAPIVNIYRDQGKSVLERNNIYFFTENGAFNTNSNIDPNSCTFEHPCNATQFTQTTIDQINGFAPDANFYLESGNYSLNGQLLFLDGQSIWGRTDDFSQPAMGNQRPVLSGSLTLSGNNTVDSLQLVNDGSQFIGMEINNANDIIINNTAIGGNNNGQSYTTAINLVNAENISIKNSTIDALIDASTTNSNINGILANNSSFNLENSTIDVGANGSNDTINTFGINANNSNITLNNSTINSHLNTSQSSDMYATGISATNSQLTINQSNITANITDNDTSAAIFENATAISIADSHLQIQNSNITANATANDPMGNMYVGAFGLEEADSQITAMNNQFNVNATTTGSASMMTMSYGIYTNGGNLNQSENTFNVTANCSTWNCMFADVNQNFNLLLF